MGGCCEDGAVVVLEDFEPCGDIGGVVLARFLMQFEIGAQESGAKLGNEFLAAVAFVAPALAAEIALRRCGCFVTSSSASFHGRGWRNKIRHRGKLQTVASVRNPIPARSRRDFRSA